MKRRRSTAAERSPSENAGLHLNQTVIFLAVGRLQRTHGVRGEMLMEVITDFPERLRKGKEVYIGSDHTSVCLSSVRRADRALLVAFEGYEDVNRAAALRNQIVYVRSDQIPALPEGVYYHHQLLGLRVVDEDGRVLGELEQILETGANDVYLVRMADGEELLLPAIQEVIIGVDLEEGTMRVRPPEWL
jgi:16S rRNA processing protein RimM